ncbi:MAG: UDP-N-acetylmuramoyl-L-alanine--D-glutamate ligase [Treponemataceae bacterium]|nr:UDP-N-acetylmuramoyl-L-alanine--D-glutamate ligase [Treponemataceae bacterium]
MNAIPFSYPAGCAFSSVDDIRGKKITVMGLGLNGGGEACVRFFLSHGASVTATDMKTAEQLKPTIDSIENDAALDRRRLVYRLGRHVMEDFSSADCVIKNPGVKIEGNAYLAAAKAVETDISIFLRFTKSPIIAVTGSKGKSSTVSALHYGLSEAGFRAFLGGNITVSPLSFLEETGAGTPVILELSSWQLADLRGRGVLKPHISIITKIVPDHQNWYSGMEPYIADKRLVYADQTPDDFAIFDANGDEPGTGPACGGTWGDCFAAEANAAVLRYSTSPLPRGVYGVWQERDSGGFCGNVLLPGMEAPETILRGLAVPGDHMRTNVLNAALVMRLMHVPAEKIIRILGGWQGIAHRLQCFHTFQTGGGTDAPRIRFFNDSCATVPEAAAAASQAFGRPVVLIAGGTDKGLSFEPLVQTLAGAAPEGSVPPRALYLLAGTGTDKMLPALDAAGVPYKGPFESLQSLLLQLRADAAGFSEDAAVVFSPGATSFGMFANEFHRGNAFMECVRGLFPNNPDIGGAER